MKKSIHFVLALSLVLLISACSGAVPMDQSIATVWPNQSSEYEKTFQELHLGLLFDFDLKLSQADQSWVSLWFEGYRNGEPAGEVPFQSLSFGHFPQARHEGRLGFGLIGHQSQNPLLILYSSGASLNPTGLNEDFFEPMDLSTWDYAIGPGERNLGWGEEVILAVYRKGTDGMRSGYDYQNKEEVSQMIKDDEMVLLMKMKVEKKTR